MPSAIPSPYAAHIANLKSRLGIGTNAYTLGQPVRYIGAPNDDVIPPNALGVVTAPWFVCTCCGQPGIRVALIARNGNFVEVNLEPHEAVPVTDDGEAVQ